MVLIKSALVGGAAIAGSLRALQRAFPPMVNYPKIGSLFHLSDGTVKQVIGFFGSSDKTARQIDHSRDLFFAKTPNETLVFSKSRCEGEGHRPTISLVVAEKNPDPEDFGDPWFEGSYAPLSPEGQRKLNVQVLPYTEVNTQTQPGIIGSIYRAYEAIKCDEITVPS